MLQKKKNALSEIVLINLALAGMDPFWISFVKNGDKWEWLYMDNVPYTKWKSGEPDQCCPVGKANRAFSAHNGWSDVGPTFKTGVMCKYEIKLPYFCTYFKID